MFDERDRPVFRIDIKFHGSPFRKAKEMVGLDPHDCFALATYKIHSATQKQEQEVLPYLFVASLDGMLERLRDHGLQGLTGRIERGTI